jgi:hypothetical protein
MTARDSLCLSSCFAVAATFLLVARPAMAQQQTPPPQSSSGTTSTGPTGSTGSSGSGDPEPTQERKAAPKQGDRLFFLLPNFMTVQNADNVPPLRLGEKYSLVRQGAFDLVEYPWYAFTAGISQANNTDPTLGSGWGGYGKRYALAFADGTSENFLVGAVLPGVFHQDPRYFQMGTGGFWHRAGYAASRIVVTRTDSGHSTINYSEIFGSGLAAGFANLYHPKADRTLSSTLGNWRTLAAYDTLTIFFREFWPDIRKVF